MRSERIETMYILPPNERNSNLQINHFDMSGRYGLPNSVREALLSSGLGDSALLMDVLIRCGVRAGKLLTIKQIHKLEIKLPDGLIRRGLAIFKQGRARTGKRGRPEAVFHMPGVSDLVQAYAHGLWTPTDDVEDEDMASLKLYRQALHREFIRRAPGCYSRAFLGNRLGVGKRTMRNYDRETGVIAQQRFHEYRIDWLLNWDDVMRAGKKAGQFLRLVFGDGRVMNAPLKIGIVWKYLGEAAVYVVTQLTNEYRLGEELRPLPY
jgi:hypothetical protein